MYRSSWLEQIDDSDDDKNGGWVATPVWLADIIFENLTPLRV